jgi:cytochrome P450
LSRDALGLLTRVTREYGDLVYIRLGLTPVVVVGHPELVEEVLVTRNHDYRKGQQTRRLGSLLGNRVVTETLRLYPTAWAIGREALRDTTIGGQRVPRGTTVLMLPWVMHRDPRFYDEPEAFRPERWAHGLLERLPRFAYLPFGGGQRVCIGASFAQLEATLLLATIAQRFRIEFTEPTQQVEPWPVVTLRTRADVPMRLVSRTPQ